MRGNASAAELTFQVTLTTAGAVSVGGGMAAGVTLGLGKAAKYGDEAAMVMTKGKCFVAGSQVLQPAGVMAIESIEIGDRVLAADVEAAASTDGGEEVWTEVTSTPMKKSAAWAPRGVCDRVKRWARTAAVPMAMLAACDVAEMPEADEAVQVYDARTGDWFDGDGADLEDGDTFIDDGRVLRVTEDGVEVRGDAAVEELAEADSTWVAEAAHRLPSGEDWVLVLGASDDAGHWLLSEVEAGERFAFQGRVFDTSDADGKLAVRGSGDVLARVVDTFVRMAPAVIDAEVSYADGTRDTLTGTPNHPFWVDAVQDYAPLGELEVGTVLHVQGGGEAILLSKTWRQGEFEVFDFEVEGLHNFYVRGEGSDAAGVLVHNSSADETVDIFRAVSPAEFDDIVAHRMAGHVPILWSPTWWRADCRVWCLEIPLGKKGCRSEPNMALCRPTRGVLLRESALKYASLRAMSANAAE
jgi:hypothetical protein